ncbi:TetR/AcrR family transcriptional regulator [Paraburkholderia sediminicola]|jgi:AcrR family transcriptional regulator|uniref:TetR/AcrR family transcriptional regulator n=1 Tax=Paraburkholderia rhynchosiae TaxID=487049 RepID=A0ACC7NCK2_9BURK
MPTSKTPASKKLPSRLPVSKSTQRRRELLSTAADMFLARGYDGVTLDEIIAEVGGSKSNVYKHFKGKESLFIAAVEYLSDEISSVFADSDAFSLPLRLALTSIGQTFYKAVLHPRAIALQRLAIAESSRFPQVGQTWFDRGPRIFYEAMTKFCEERQARGELRTCDAQEAAILFHDMMAFNLSHQLLLGIIRPPKASIVEAKVRFVVDAFLNGFAHEQEQKLSSGGQHTAAVAAVPDRLKLT